MPKGYVIMALISVFLIGSGYFLALMYMKAVMYADFMVVALYILLALKNNLNRLRKLKLMP